MMHSLHTTICIHAMTDDLRFLKPVRTRLAKILAERCVCYELTDPRSNAVARAALHSAADGLVVLFAHRMGADIRGGAYRNRTGEIVEVESFLGMDDLHVFRGKAVFGMTCESNAFATLCMNAGALAFVGFDKVPLNRYDGAGNRIGSHTLVKHCENLLADAVKATLDRFVRGRGALDESADFLRLWIVKNAVAYVRQRKMSSVKERREVAALFLRVGDGVRYHGPPGVWFANHD